MRTILFSLLASLVLMALAKPHRKVVEQHLVMSGGTESEDTTVDQSQPMEDSIQDGSISGRLSWPRWPHDFAWNSAGPINGRLCTRILEPSDPHTWSDNYFCSVQGPGWINPQFQWSFAGPISGMRCTQILEAADPNTWADNYLCVPHCSPYMLKWSSAGPIPGLECIQWLEAADPHTWNDNYLCM